MASKKKPSPESDLSDGDLLDALGIETEVESTGGHTAEEERIIAGFEEIQRFVEQHDHAPRHGEGLDIFERLYAVRLDRLRHIPEVRTLLAGLDTTGLLTTTAGNEQADLGELDDSALLAQLGGDTTDDDDITVLKHVKSYAEKTAAEEIANRQPCEDFDKFKPLFDEAETGLKAGLWQTKPFSKDASVELGDFFIVSGQTAYVAAILDDAKTKDGRDNPRLRVIFSNGTESDLLLRSLSRSLYPDGDQPVGRRLIKIDAGPLFNSTWEDGDVQSGTIYVLRSLSNDPRIAEHRQFIHKIGVTGGKVETRIADAENDATYLLAKVEVVATYKLAGVDRTKVEGLFHKLFASAQLDLTILDRFGKPIKPREWFLVPLPVIDEAVQRLQDGSIVSMVYDPETGKLVAV